MEPLITCENLVKIYKVSGLEVVALQGLDLEIQQGELMGIVGASGSGKTTLLNILGGLDRPSAGRLTVNGRNLLKASDRVLDEYRRTEVGFVWQQTARNLIPYLSAQANIELPMTIEAKSWREKRAWTRELLETVGLWEHRKHRLAQLSGGQQQRVAIAVALANKPRILLGDEPTGEVDSGTAQDILALFRRMNEQYGLTTIIVTHDPQVARVVDRVVTIRDGRTSSETVRRVNEALPRSVQAVEAALAQSAQQVSASAVKPTEYEEYVVVDAAGRLQIPPDLRQELGIGVRVTLEKTADGGVSIYPVAGAQPTASSQDQEADSTDVRELANEDQPASPQRKGLRRWLRRNKK
jgi:ABC-type lipoprotein export system ATPase subunit/bifunctional DNA-binding transcriptional regulator/antitoxin component of YhaV-PrlF toxin-antitoxin module